VKFGRRKLTYREKVEKDRKASRYRKRKWGKVKGERNREERKVVKEKDSQRLREKNRIINDGRKIDKEKGDIKVII
jgi:hypothetical protein